MSRFGEIELNLKSDSLSVEDVKILLQAIRDWEQKRQIDIFIGINAPWMSNDETGYIFNSLEPPLANIRFIPLKEANNGRTKTGSS